MVVGQDSNYGQIVLKETRLPSVPQDAFVLSTDYFILFIFLFNRTQS